MPARNTVKQYLENGYYHIYNRGVEKRLTFVDQQDYNVFLTYLEQYLLPKNDKALREKLFSPTTRYQDKDHIIKLLRLNNYSDEIKLISYCLMPNHFHFLVKQKSAQSIHKFMQSFMTRYTMYFNKKYNRVGSLFQAVYKAVLVTQEEQLIYLTKYIHKQSLALQGETLHAQPSSYKNYVEKKYDEWIRPEVVLQYFSKLYKNLSYENFIAENDNYPQDFNKIIIEFDQD
jgi:putative transposase